MKFEKIHDKGQAQIFRNQFLEYFTKTHPLVIWGLYFPVIILLPYYAWYNIGFTTLRITILFLSGIFFWTFFEYMMHRFVFHWVSDNPVSYTHLRAHETGRNLVCRILLEKKKKI